MSNQDPYGTPPAAALRSTAVRPAARASAAGRAVRATPAPPPPPKKRTGLIIGAIVAALVVIGGLVVGGIVLLGGDDDKKETSSEKARERRAASTRSRPTSPPRSRRTSPPTPPARSSGTNYTYSLPGEQWVDATADAAAAGTVVDSAAAWGEQIDGSRANVLVEAGIGRGHARGAAGQLGGQPHGGRFEARAAPGCDHRRGERLRRTAAGHELIRHGDLPDGLPDHPSGDRLLDRILQPAGRRRGRGRVRRDQGQLGLDQLPGKP